MTIIRRREYPSQDQISMHDGAINIPLFAHDGTFEKWVHEDELYVIYNGATHINYRTEDGKYQGYFEARKPRSVNYEQVLQHFNTPCVEYAKESALPVFNEDGFLRWQQPLKGSDYPLSIQIDGREYQLFMSAAWFSPVKEASQLHLGYFSANCEGTEIETLRRFYDYDPTFNPERKINMINRHDVDEFRVSANNSGNLLDSYQEIAGASAFYPGKGGPTGLGYVALKLNGEAGEFAEHMGKAMRDDNYGVGGKTTLTDERRVKMIKELGDILWYVQAGARELGIPLSQVALVNLEKLCDRGERDALKGSGDDR